MDTKTGELTNDPKRIEELLEQSRGLLLVQAEYEELLRVAQEGRVARLAEIRARPGMSKGAKRRRRNDG